MCGLHAVYILVRGKTLNEDEVSEEKVTFVFIVTELKKHTELTHKILFEQSKFYSNNQILT